MITTVTRPQKQVRGLQPSTTTRVSTLERILRTAAGEGLLDEDVPLGEGNEARGAVVGEVNEDAVVGARGDDLLLMGC